MIPWLIRTDQIQLSPYGDGIRRGRILRPYSTQRPQTGAGQLGLTGIRPSQKRESILLMQQVGRQNTDGCGYRHAGMSLTLYT